MAEEIKHWPGDNDGIACDAIIREIRKGHVVVGTIVVANGEKERVTCPECLEHLKALPAL